MIVGNKTLTKTGWGIYAVTNNLKSFQYYMVPFCFAKYQFVYILVLSGQNETLKYNRYFTPGSSLLLSNYSHSISIVSEDIEVSLF